MTSITANVKKYSASLTAKANRGGTKKKSKARTLTIDAAIAGPRPYRAATNATPSRNTMTMLASLRPNQSLSQPKSPHTATTAAVTRKWDQLIADCGCDVLGGCGPSASPRIT